MQMLTERGLYGRLGQQAKLSPGPDYVRSFRGALNYRTNIGFYVGQNPVEDGDNIKFPGHGEDGERTVKFKHDGLIDGVRI